MDRFAEAKGHNHVHGHATESIVQVCALSSLALPLEGGAECFRHVYTQTLGALDCSLREGPIEHILARLGFSICEEAKAGFIFIEALIQAGLFVPAVFVVVDVVVSLRVGKVELRDCCQHTVL
jgi:hypothetical protein